MKRVTLFVLSVLFLTGASPLRAENIGVPSECEDVMLQCFYWDSHTLKKYGRTKWADLLPDSTAIRENFDVVWFPPSAKSTGGVGYYHVCLSEQGGAWGQKASLVNLIAALHRGNTKCLADIVINHRGNCSNWCDFCPDDFGEGYGKFQLEQTHICKGDECFTTKESTCYAASKEYRGNSDTGTNDGGARDLDHTSEYVQNWAKTYVRWMREVMKYDGFRYDMTRGYHGQYLSMYNEVGKPYMSVSEYWMDDIKDPLQHLAETNNNTMIFDFPLKWKIKDALGGNTPSLTLLKNPSNSFRGQGKEKYAVTFIDNHDTFERSDNTGAEFGGYNVDLSTAKVKNKILQANAYILMMPGVPCVFWPHWKSYTWEINQLIKIRKLAGIHSESKVTDETATQTSYSATIEGHHHKAILRLGSGRDKTVPAGYYVHAEGEDYAVYMEGVQGIDEVRVQQPGTGGEKFMENGQLFIRRNGRVFNAQGQLIEK